MVVSRTAKNFVIYWMEIENMVMSKNFVMHWVEMDDN